MDEYNRRMSAALRRHDQCASELNVAIRELYVLTPFDLDAARRACRGTLALPGERDDLAGSLALKRNARLDRFRQGYARTGKELVIVGSIKRTHVPRFIERHEPRLAESAELLPHLQVDERVGPPLIDARVLTKSFFIGRLHDGSLTRGNRVYSTEKGHDNRCGDRYSPSGSSNHLTRITPRTVGDQSFITVSPPVRETLSGVMPYGLFSTNWRRLRVLMKRW